MGTDANRIRLTVPAGTDPREAWSNHVRAFLAAQRCPRCGGEMLDGSPQRAGWWRCRRNGWPDGWWRSDEISWEWRLGMDPHTGEDYWRD